jgi:hypothetical protein
VCPTIADARYPRVRNKKNADRCAIGKRLQLVRRAVLEPEGAPADMLGSVRATSVHA